MSNVDSKLTVERLREALSYDPETGIFRRNKASGRIRTGDLVGCLTKTGYISIEIDNQPHRAHRLAWAFVNGLFPKDHIDHINGDRADNRISNLREATRSLNNQNLRKAKAGNVTGLLGVFPVNKRFRSRINANGRLIELGYFSTAEEAHSAYIEAKRLHHQGNML